MSWRLWVDTGGTFSDCVAIDPSGRSHRLKILSSGRLRARITARENAEKLTIDTQWCASANLSGFKIRRQDEPSAPATSVIAHHGHDLIIEPNHAFNVGDVVELYSGEPAPTVAARLFTGAPFPHPLPPMRLRLATTRGTNALLERAVAPTAFFVTRGFADLLEIGDQRRPHLFELDIAKPAPLHTYVVEVDERIIATGEVIRPLDLAQARNDALRALSAGCSCAAVALLHSWRNPEHESSLAAMLRDVGFAHVSQSSALSAEAKLLPRARTAVVNAALSPTVGSFLRSVSAGAAAESLHVMTSAGGLKHSDRFQPVDGLLSGPAGGVIGAADAAARAGFERIITFDMGGTSTDVSRVDGAPALVFEHTVGDAILLSPALRIETVAAGGGSICGFENGRPFVGPRSAGADPGPACYGAGGPFTITDVNLLLRRIDPAHFETPVNPAAAVKAFENVLRDGAMAHVTADERESILSGFLDIANEHMAAAIRRISVRHGYDPADYALVAFGGAGPQHACAVAQRLGCATVYIPPDASLLSAHGVGAVRLTEVAQRTILAPYDEAALTEMFAPLEFDARRGLEEQGARPVEIELERLVELRIAGQSFAITVQVEKGVSPKAHFLQRHEATFGFLPVAPEIEVVSARVVARWNEREASDAAAADGHFNPAPIRSRGDVNGPAVIAHPHTMIVVEAGWRACFDQRGGVHLHRAMSAETDSGAAMPTTASSLIRGELIIHRLEAIAEQMGAALQRAALSTNVKERLDYSCAILNTDGEVVVSAPHIPVHLGALGHCVRAVVKALPLGPGDVAVTNHPAYGGSHLPDVTVIAPVHTDNGALLGYTASRAHHAEIGGVRPGSMPPDATTLAEEGVVIPPTRLVRAGVTDWAPILALLTKSHFPTRSLRENQSDLMAALAAARHADGALMELSDAFGPAAIHYAMRETLERTEAAVLAAIATRAGETLTINDALDDGSPICAVIEFGEKGATIDFTGTAATHPGNLNAPPAVVRSAVAYVMRLLIDTPVTINDGLLRAVTLNVPPGLLNPAFTDDPSTCPAVAGGNVETSQRLVNALVRALRLAADSQGTMNNLIIGGDGFSYYETLAGGAGATANADGAHAVHTHMTNTAITDPEVFEIRYPLRVIRTAIRRGSGGAGVRHGGDGLTRELEFLAPTAVSMLTQNRARGPRGVDGGADGAPGSQRLIRANGLVEQLGPVDGRDAAPGDRIIIETPGGGGWERGA